ncbi:MAG: prephenate dehydrogenase/arogenate dehydrogenase family protein [Nitrospirae bacterium]|nr:prephenate dehydrogenase/arogenate dehydrogenase family protein [Nitrospirota bacterium]
MKINFNRIAIIGVGLIGGSFALALKANGFKGTIAGIGRNRKNLVRAKKLGAIDEYTTVPSIGVRDADLILLATPVGQFVEKTKQIKPFLKNGAIVTDVGSVKAEVIKNIGPLMPGGVCFVGGHPIAGRECSGVNAASAGLFKNTKCIITPDAHTDKKALRKIISLWKALGAKTVIMTPDEHDVIYASVSHLPHVVAYSLVNSILDLNGDILGHGGRGLGDMTRIALSPPELWRDICRFNKKHILKSLDHFILSLIRTKKFIKNSDWDRLESEFLRAKAGRGRLDLDNADRSGR